MNVNLFVVGKSSSDNKHIKNLHLPLTVCMEKKVLRFYKGQS